MHRGKRTKLAEWLEMNVDGEGILPVGTVAELAQFGVAFDALNRNLAFGDSVVEVEVLEPEKVRQLAQARQISWLQPGSWSGVDGVVLAESLVKLLGMGSQSALYANKPPRTRFTVAVKALKGESTLPEIDLATPD
jgi:hypothetical protein